MTGTEIYMAMMIPFLGFCGLYVVFNRCMTLLLGKEVVDDV